MTTGRIAGETVVWLKRRREELSKANLRNTSGGSTKLSL